MALESSEQSVARRGLALLEEVAARPTLVNIASAARELAPHRASLGRAGLTLKCLSSFTFQPLVPALELQGLRAGISLTVEVGPFGQIEQGLLDPNFWREEGSQRPEVILIAARLRDVCPAVYEEFNSLEFDRARQLLSDWNQRLAGALDAFRKRSKSAVLIQNYEQPAYPAMGLADGGPLTQTRLIREANEELSRIAGHVGNVHVMDYDALVARHGRARWTDPRTALYARMAVAPEHLWSLAGFYVRHLRPLCGLSKKVLMLDADNTLWGGVIGDVGLDGIALGPDYPGNAYVAFQKKVLDLHRRGVVLCLNTKNEPGSVEEVLENHPAMVLRRKHFAAMRVNWKPKHENTREMVSELNLGIDSFVFIDDSPVECEMMRNAFPEVMTLCAPKEPAELPGVIDSLDCFDQFQISDEDRARGQMYQAESSRQELRAGAVDLPSFYRQLEMSVTVAINRQADISRAAQLTSRTNQFNMHTLRYSEDDIRRFMATTDHWVVTLALTDRFGDNGVVGLAIVRRDKQEWVLHVFLMSCRVLGRTVEQCFVKWIAAAAKKAGAKRLIGDFVLTAKNKPFARFYESCRFVEAAPTQEGGRWTLDLATAHCDLPDWMKVTVFDSSGAV